MQANALSKTVKNLCCPGRDPKTGLALDAGVAPGYRHTMPTPTAQSEAATGLSRSRTAKPQAKPRASASKTQGKGKGKRGEAARITQVLDELDRLYPDAHCELLGWKSPLQLLVAVILSAQCTDERVNQVTPALFARYPDARALMAAESQELEQLIRSTGFYRNKAKHIRGACKAIVEKHGGEVPRTIKELVALPGVARKTANVVLGTAYGIPSGVVVDTHIGRLARRLDMTRHTDPVKVESDLMAAWPEERWIMSGHRLIWHGRRVCHARKPRCAACTLAPLCPSAEVPA